MKIALAQLNFMVGNFEGNLQKMIDTIKDVKNKGAELVVFGELATCGYPPRDFLEFKDFIASADHSLKVLAEHSHDIGIIVGSPSINPKIEGKDLYNSAFVLHHGQIIHQSNKALLPTYDIFDEYRYFEPAKSFEIFEFKGLKIALTICEDIWNVGNENPLYEICPMDQLILQKPDIMINISASPFNFEQAKTRLEVIKANVERYKIPMYYCNIVGAQTDVVFDGGSVVMNAEGIVHCEMPYFIESCAIFDSNDVKLSQIAKTQPKAKNALIHDAILLGIKDYFSKLGFKDAILGLSGGIDSAVTTVMAVRALGADHVRVLLMPSEYSSEHSLSDAIQLAQNLGIRYDVVPIKNVFDAYEYLLNPYFADTPQNITEENIQARIRGMLLMAMSNKFGNILLNTSNKSEMAVGYGTLYGDMCGGLAVLGDVYKTEVYDLAAYINKDEQVIPQHSIEKPPSAELRPGQKDSDSLPLYDILDPILYQYIEERKGPEEIISNGNDPALVKRILRLVNINEFKREQTAPVIRVSRKAFGMGRRMPIVGKYLS